MKSLQKSSVYHSEDINGLNIFYDCQVTHLQLKMKRSKVRLLNEDSALGIHMRISTFGDKVAERRIFNFALNL